MYFYFKYIYFVLSNFQFIKESWKKYTENKHSAYDKPLNVLHNVLINQINL